jgi:hypothetical protein
MASHSKTAVFPVFKRKFCGNFVKIGGEFTISRALDSTLPTGFFA